MTDLAATFPDSGKDTQCQQRRKQPQIIQSPQVIQSTVARKAYTSDLSDAAWETIAPVQGGAEALGGRTDNWLDEQFSRPEQALRLRFKNRRVENLPCVDFLHEQKVDDKTQRPKVEHRKRGKTKKILTVPPKLRRPLLDATEPTSWKDIQPLPCFYFLLRCQAGSCRLYLLR